MSDIIETRSLGSEIDFDAVVVGAGVTGVYQLYRLREAGLRVLALEAADSVGGTWRANRYPGCRLDSESYSYGYFFSQELWDEWSWSEHFVTQPELERYMNFVVDKFDLAPHIRLNAKVTSASFDEEQNVWAVTVNSSENVSARHIILATGLLSTPFVPQVKGKEHFAGSMFHTFNWPEEGVDLKGKRVAVMGAGSTGVQLAPVIADQVEELIMFQRTANWCTPLNNAPLTEDDQREIKSNRDRYEQLTLKSPGGFLHAPTKGDLAEDPADVRTALFERLYSEGRGYQKIYGQYRDVSLNPEANRILGEFFAQKIKERVHDPVVAEKLIPKDHGPNMRRPPMETNYYEMFNRSNVKLVDLRETPIEEITSDGIRTTEQNFDVDIIVWATGFDAITGTMARMQLRGRDGTLLADAWKEGVRTLWGITVPQFPNMFMAGGPHFPAGNTPRATQLQVDFITELLSYSHRNDVVLVEAEDDAVREWMDHVADTAATRLVADSSWFVGGNIPGKRKETLIYMGGLPSMRERLQKTVATGFEGLSLKERATILS